MKSSASSALHLSQRQHHDQDDGHHHHHKHKDVPPLQSTPSTTDISAEEGDSDAKTLSLDATSSSPSGAGSGGHFDGLHHSSSQQDLSAGGYGWYDNEEGMGSMSPYGGEDDDGDDSRGRGGGDQHVSVLTRMETFREDMRGETSGIKEGEEEEEEGGEDGEERQPDQHHEQEGHHNNGQQPHLHHLSGHHHHHRRRSSVAHESGSNNNTSSGSNVYFYSSTGRHHDHRHPDKEILFHLPQTNFSVMTRQFLLDDDDSSLRRSSTISSSSSRDNVHHQHYQHSHHSHYSHNHHHSHHHHHHHHQQHQRRKKKQQPLYAALGVGGLRICQTSCGGQHAEFLVCLCLNQQTFVAWKRFSAFAQLFQDAHMDYDAHLLYATRRAWENLESRRKWSRCLEIKYLAQKLTFLEMFLGAFLMEVPSPALLVSFASSDVTPSPIKVGDGFWPSSSHGMAAEMHDMTTSSSSSSRRKGNVMADNSGSREELMLCEKVRQAGTVGVGVVEGGGAEEEEGAGGR